MTGEVIIDDWLNLAIASIETNTRYDIVQSSFEKSFNDQIDHQI